MLDTPHSLLHDNKRPSTESPVKEPGDRIFNASKWHMANLIFQVLGLHFSSSKVPTPPMLITLMQVNGYESGELENPSGRASHDILYGLPVGSLSQSAFTSPPIQKLTYALATMQGMLQPTTLITELAFTPPALQEDAHAPTVSQQMMYTLSPILEQVYDHTHASD
ncbi:hypothetical protein Hypma_008166 [Hypsizygus marmoreus]|uniref:Uncharacterized protein n=1 Tax=Hypsizygus marmoreus TaxID=39966 RepID=A0A369K0Y1_HYPMA|nr:hypothetical protein Hypma_008166 [Hypsizygus marmoreus]